jgi:MFS family permease
MTAEVSDTPQETQVSWGVIIMLAAAQFIMVLDTTVMNVSITQVAEDLNTTIVGLQTAITMYTLVMAAFMLLGGKLGDRWGAKRAFTVGLLVYGLGSFITAISPTLGVLLVGWSFIEGFGAVLVIPAIATLTAATYSGRQRALAYGILGGVAGASAALGPLIGGWMTANASWRYVFAGETIVVLALMLFLRLIPRTAGNKTKLDLSGAFLSIAGLGMAVFGILRSSQWGWIAPSASVPTINGVPLTPLGLSPVFWLISGGLVLLGLFMRHERAMLAAGKEPLLDVRLLHIPPMQAGLTTYLSQQFIIMGTFFVLPLFLQVVLGYDALETGIMLLPLSVALFVAALAGARLSGRYSPRRIVTLGLTLMLIGEILLIAFTDVDLRSTGFAIALALVGAGNGLIVSQLGNVIMSSVPAERGSEAGGLQGTAMNLGASLGVALIGSILIASLVSNFQTGVMANPVLAEVAPQLTEQAEQNANFVTVDQVNAAAQEAGLSTEEVDAVTTEYAEAQIMALKVAFAAIAFSSLLSLWYVQSLPKRAGGDNASVEASPGGTTEPALAA